MQELINLLKMSKLTFKLLKFTNENKIKLPKLSKIVTSSQNNNMPNIPSSTDLGVLNYNWPI